MFTSKFSGFKKWGRLMLCVGALLALKGVTTGCSTTKQEVANKLTGNEKKPDGTSCAKDEECIHVCLTQIEAEKTYQQPNTCGQSERSRNN